MKNKKIISLFLAVIMILVPVSISAGEMKGYSNNRDVHIINDDIYNLVYTHRTDDGLYKTVEHMTMDLKKVESDIYKLNIKTNEFEHKKHISLYTDANKIFMETIENDIMTSETYNITDYFNLNHDKVTGKGSININGYGDWHTSYRSGDTFLTLTTISALIVTLTTLIGNIAGSVMGVSNLGSAVGAGVAYVAEKIFSRNVLVLHYESAVTWRYMYPYYDYEVITDFYDDYGGYLGTSEDDGRLTINM